MNDPLTDPREVRQRLLQAIHQGTRVGPGGRDGDIPPMGGMVRQVMLSCEIAGYSGEDSMTMLAYYALCQLEASHDRELQYLSCTPSSPIEIVYKKG